MTDCNEDHESGRCSVGRRRFVQGCGATLALAVAGSDSLIEEAVAKEEDEPTVGDLLAGMPDNWGRWGEDDELGAINLLDGRQMFEGMTAAIQRGRFVQRFTLQTPITGEAIDVLVGEGEAPTTDTGDPLFPGRTPARRDNVADGGEGGPDPLGPFGGMFFADDKFVTPLFLQGTTHFDALAHAWYDDQLYNGYDVSTTRTKKDYDFGVEGCEDGKVTETFGLGKADISNAADAGVAGRGVLLDVGRFKGEAPNYRLDLGEAVTLEDLQATAEEQGVRVQERDILLVRTGAVERVSDPEAEWDPNNEPGLTYSDDLVEWFVEKDIPVVGADNLAVEKITQEVSEDDLADGREELAGTYLLPLHGALLRDLGVTIHEIADLSALAEQAAADGIYEFLYTAAPVNAEGSTGAPINPVVLKATDPPMEDGESPGRGDDRGRGEGSQG